MNPEMKVILRIEDMLADPSVFDSGNPHPYRMGLIDALLAIGSQSNYAANVVYIGRILDQYCDCDNSDDTPSGIQSKELKK